jgi:hypothetical protein
MRIFRWRIQSRNAHLQHSERALLFEVVSFTALFGIAVFLLEVHRFMAAGVVFSSACVVLALRLLKRAFKRVPSIKWIATVLIFVATIYGLKYLLGVVDESQSEREVEILGKANDRQREAFRLRDERRREAIPKPNTPTSPTSRIGTVFSVAEEFPILSPGGNDLGTKFWLRTPTPKGCTISQAQAALYIRIKNLRPYPVTVVSYSVEAAEPLIRIPTPNRSILGINKPGMTFYGATKAGQVIPVTQGSGLAAMSETPFDGLDFSKAKVLEMDSLDEQIAKPIAPDIPIRGWIFFEYPVDQFGYVSVLYKNLVMKIKTNRDGSFSYWLRMEPGDPNGDVLPRNIKIKDVIDVSDCARKRYELPS